MTIDRATALDLYRVMRRIRRFEQRSTTLFGENKIWGTIHSYAGEEAIAAGVCAHLRDDDWITSTHRGHGHCIAKRADLGKMYAELLGRETGYCRGRGGSMHIADTSKGNLGANGIVGGGIPIATGAALTAQQLGTDQVAVSFFGDGAANEGTFHESLNLAQLWKTKTVFVCENNHWAESTPGWQHSPVWDDMSKRALAYDMRSIKVDGQDVEAVYEAAQDALEYARSGHGPVFLDVETKRMHGHFIGDPQVYRSKEDREDAAEHDPIPRLRERLGLSEDEFETFDAEAHKVVDEALEFAKNGTDPQPEDALKNVYA